MAKYLKKAEREKAIKSIKSLSLHLKENCKLYEEVLDFFCHDEDVIKGFPQEIECLEKDVNESIRSLKIIIRRSDILFEKINNKDSSIKCINFGIHDIKNMFLSYKNNLYTIDGKIKEINNKLNCELGDDFDNFEDEL